MDSVFKREQGLGGREMIAQRKAKSIGAIEKSAGRHQAVLSFCKKGYVRVCPVLIAGCCSSHNVPVTRDTRAYYEHEKLKNIGPRNDYI